MDSESRLVWQAAASSADDIFAKYLRGEGVNHMPFRLVADPEPRGRGRRGGARGPYRRYAAEEKHQIIARMLQGEGLKKLADETAIPKRNLIRWKHEYLHKAGGLTRHPSDHTDDSPLPDHHAHHHKELIETKEILSEQSLDPSN